MVNLKIVESRTEKGRGNKTINIIACDQDKKKFLRISYDVLWQR